MQIVKTLPAELNELRAASTASGGTALTTTVTGAGNPKTALGITPIPIGSDYVSVTPRDYGGCDVVRYTLNPYLTVFYTADAGYTNTDISDELQDGDTTDIAIDSLPITGTGYMYVGARVPFRGVAVDIGSDPNGTASDLTVVYWNGTSWVDISDTDATDTGAAFAVDGTVTWTVPSNWSNASLKAIGTSIGSGVEYVMPNGTPQHFTSMYWTRWEWSAAMDTSTDIIAMYALNRSTAPAEYIEGQTVELMLNSHEIGSIQGATNAGTAKLLVNAGTLTGSEFE